MPKYRSIRIPGRRDYGGVLILEVVLNNLPGFAFIVDTGAAITAVTNRVTQALGLDPNRPIRMERIGIAQGRMIEVPVVRVDSLRLGDVEARNVETLVVDLPSELRVHGLLGVNFLEPFSPTFDFARGSLVLRRRV